MFQCLSHLLPMLHFNVTVSTVVNWDCTLTCLFFTHCGARHMCPAAGNNTGPFSVSVLKKPGLHYQQSSKRTNFALTKTLFLPCSDLWSAECGSSLAYPREPEAVSGASHLMSDEVVAQSVQTAGDVGQAHSYLYEQTDGLHGATVCNHFLVHLERRTEKH